MNQLQIETIDHYGRMKNYAKEQPAEEKPNSGEMERKIGENWYSASCPYCQKFNLTFDESSLNACKACPLRNRECPDSDECCNGLWYKLAKSGTWKEWLEYADKIQAHVKLHGYYEEKNR